MVRRFNRNRVLAKRSAKNRQKETTRAVKNTKNKANMFLVNKAKQFIRNLSDYRLSGQEILALGKGLYFIPNPNKPRIFHIK